MDIADQFEERFISVVDKILDESGITRKDFAEKVFANQAKPDNKWLRMRKNLNAGKPQRVTLSEAYRIAKALNYDLASLFWRIQKELESKSKSLVVPEIPGKKKRAL